MGRQHGYIEPALYLIRHCEAGGPPGPGAPLTERGQAQALELSQRLANMRIRRIVSSPYMRAMQSIAPLATRLGLSVETDEGLIERQVPFDPNLDWKEHIRPTFLDLDLVLPNGESSRAAKARAAAAISDVLRRAILPAAIVTHGQLLTLALMHLDNRFGFEDWVYMTSPDVFQATMLTDGVEVVRIWS